MKNIIIGGLLFIIALLLSSGIIMVQPNQAAVLMFFGRYVGSVRESGLWMTVPLSTRKNISLRVRNFNSSKLKVNDLDGNPIEIAAVIVFRVIDSAKALLDVDDYQTYVEIQSETSIRHIASQYPYDAFDRDVYSLRSHTDEIAERLSENVQERLRVAGVEVLEARLTHLAYSTEIAAAMLQRQQAAAIVAARQQIVEGAVGMVEMAIAQLVKDGIVELDDERKANMINNLLVAIVSDRGAQPVINTSSLY
jgi:regulator of protease activity HflC (stomatin/prohibitin superfamily)